MTQAIQPAATPVRPGGQAGFFLPAVASGPEKATPILVVVFNNSRYGAVRRATLSMFKDGAAGEDDGQFLADLSPSPPFEELARAQGAHGERVETFEELAPALARARDAVRGGKQALVNVLIPN